MYSCLPYGIRIFHFTNLLIPLSKFQYYKPDPNPSVRPRLSVSVVKPIPAFLCDLCGLCERRPFFPLVNPERRRTGQIANSPQVLLKMSISQA